MILANLPRLPGRLALGLAVAISATACGAGAATQTAAPLPTVVAGGEGCPTSAPPALAAGETRTITIETTLGTIVVKVEADLGPRAAGNFVTLAGCGFYDGVVFHRTIPGFMIQGGDPTGTGRGGPGYQFADDQVTVPYTRGIVAMANAGPNTNGSQFFIVIADTGLDPSYSIFGHVTQGIEVADAIAAAADGELPTHPIAMTKVTASNP